MSGLVTDTATVFSRELRPVLRNPFSVIFSMVQPLFFLALFAPLLPDTMGGEPAIRWFVPGLILMSCLFGTSATGANLLFEINTGSHERMLVSPLRRPALIVGRALKEIVPMLVQTAIIVAVTSRSGSASTSAARSSARSSWPCSASGSARCRTRWRSRPRTMEWMFWAVQQTLIFPLLFLAGMLLPLDAGPGWLRALSRLNPLTHLVDAERALFNGEFATAAVGAGVVAAVVVATVGLLVGTRGMRRAVA